MKEELQIIKDETQNFIFEELTEAHDYWGENNRVEMIDFCNRNNLHFQKRMLIDLMKPERIKI